MISCCTEQKKKKNESPIISKQSYYQSNMVSLKVKVNKFHIPGLKQLHMNL